LENRKLYKTLIVDDELLIRQGVKHYLNWEEEGFQIVGEASNGQEALELIERTNPHIILTDVVMPIMDGEELTRIVKDKYPHIEIIILSSFGEFDYVRSTFQSGVVDYILKPKLNSQELLKVLKKAANRIPSSFFEENKIDFDLTIEHFIDKLISGYGTIEEDKIPDFSYNSFYLLGVDLNNLDSNLNKDEKIYKVKVFSLLKTTLQEADIYFIKSEQNVTVYMINTNTELNLMEFANKSNRVAPNIGFTLSEIFNDIKQIGSIYKESLLKLIQYQFYFPERILLSQQDLPTTIPEIDSFNLDWFTNEFKHERFDSAFTYLKDYSNVLSRHYTMDVYEYKSFFGHVIFNIIILLGNMKYEVKELENTKYSYFQRIDNAKTAGEVLEQLNHFLIESLDCISSKRVQAGNTNIRKLLEYIDKHYMEPLTLTDVANHFHFNPSYLSSYFSTHNNEGFIEYLNKIRIEEASKQLVTTSLSVSEISMNVGYSDHSYFCKVFKKIKGVSPSQYRRKLK
jgi:two-component system response regulator YesN